MLQRQCDQIAESTAWQCVLAREEPVVGLHAEFVSPGHGLGYEIAAHLSCGGGRYRGREEEPGVSAIAGARSLNGGWNPDLPAGVDEGTDIVDPCALVEIHREKPAGLIGQERIDTHHMSAR